MHKSYHYPLCHDGEHHWRGHIWRKVNQLSLSSSLCIAKLIPLYQRRPLMEMSKAINFSSHLFLYIAHPFEWFSNCQSSSTVGSKPCMHTPRGSNSPYPWPRAPCAGLVMYDLYIQYLFMYIILRFSFIYIHIINIIYIINYIIYAKINICFFVYI